MKSFAFAALVSAVAAISASELEFSKYAARYNKFYGDIKEFAMRLQRFVHWDKLISEHNSTNGANFHLGHNQFSDWTDAEYLAILGYKKSGTDKKDRRNVELFDDSDLPASVNWVEAGGVTPVKDQLHCGACWAFSAIGALEGAYFAKYGDLLTFSEQQLIDCDTEPHTYWDDSPQNKGCHGGDMELAFDYFKTTQAHPMLETDYAYTSGNGDETKKCLYEASKAV